LARMAAAGFTAYRPDPAAHARYADVYALYREMHRHFGEGGTDLLRRLKALHT